MAEEASTPLTDQGAGAGDSTSTANSSEAAAPGSLRGWAACRFAVNVLLPRDLSRADNVRQAAIRVLNGG